MAVPPTFDEYRAQALTKLEQETPPGLEPERLEALKKCLTVEVAPPPPLTETPITVEMHFVGEDGNAVLAASLKIRRADNVLLSALALGGGRPLIDYTYAG
ncbi:MAG: hypothetical protein SP1CHLAM54_12450 [Chlamydiia bacterium]|nr:hypothetical protein [Chlamydiia bacterium]MCH9616143.1 hypothetical protein [Chlamydiia bacterium]MCH9629871.1 hypothetical protein [Chlamydiia bacterium]